MDLDASFLAALCRSDTETVLSARAKGIDPKDLDDRESQRALEFIYEYTTTYGEVPDPVITQAKSGAHLLDTPGAIDFWVDEMMKKKLFRRLQTAYQQGAELLDGSDPEMSFEQIENSIRDIRNSRLVHQPIEPLFGLGEQVLRDYELIAQGARGIQCRWPSINKWTTGFWPQDLTMWVARVGSGKCLVYDSLVPDPDTGMLHTIQEVYENPSISKVYSWSKSGGVHARGITAKVDTGTKSCLKVTLRSGKELRLTPEHPLLTPSGWRDAKDVDVGHSLATPSKLGEPSTPVSMLDCEVDMLAALLSEGSYSGNHVSVSTTDSTFLSMLSSAAAEMGLVVKPTTIPTEEGERVPNGKDYALTAISGRKNPARQLLRAHGIDRKKAVDKTIPDCIFRLPNAQLSRFLSVFWMADGGVEEKAITITLASKKMVEQLRHLLLRMGCVCSLKYKRASCNGKTFDSWRLSVLSCSWKNFAANINLWGAKADALDKLMESFKHPQIGNPLVDEVVKSRLKRAYRESDRNWNHIGSFLGWSSNFSFRSLFCDSGQTRLSLTMLKSFGEIFGTDEFNWMYDSDIFWDDVVGVEDIGEQKIYDLTVEPTRCFIADDCIVHNTWSSLLLAHDAWNGVWCDFSGTDLVSQCEKRCTYVDDNPDPEFQDNADPVCGWKGAALVDDVHCPKCNHKTLMRTPGKRVLYVTTELSKSRIATRFYAIKYKLPYAHLRAGRLHRDDFARLKRGVEEFMDDDRLMIVGGDFDFSMGALESAIQQCNPDMMVLDGAYLMKSSGNSRVEKAANVFNDLKRLTHRSEIATVLTSQLNRQAKASDKNTVSTESIALTDVAGWNADYVIGMIQDDDMKSSRRMTFKPVKVREGDGSDMNLFWDFDTMTFDEIPPAASWEDDMGPPAQSDPYGQDTGVPF